MLFCCCCHYVKSSFAKTVMLITYVRGTDILVKQQHTYTCVAHIFHNTYMNICLGAHASWNWIALSCAVYDTCDCFSSNHNLYNRIKQNTRTLTQQLLAEHFAPPWKRASTFFPTFPGAAASGRSLPYTLECSRMECAGDLKRYQLKNFKISLFIPWK